MPTSQKVQIDTFDFGASLTAPTLGALDTGTTIANGTASTCNEQTADSGVYIANFVGADSSALIPAGTYRLRTTVSGKPLKRFVTFTGVDGEVVYARDERAAELNTAQYDAIIAAAEGSALTGPYARTVTVTDSDTSTAIQNAKVRLYRTGETGTETTNVSGVATFTVEAATWSYAITANGYTGVAGTIAVSANGNTPIAMVAATVTPPTNPSLSAIEVLCLGVDFEAESDIDIDFRIAEIETGDQNKTYSGAKVTVSSDSNGIARWEAPQGFVVEYKRGNTHSWQRVTLDSDSSTNVTSVIGSP